jgi:hypothetical protein
VQPREAGIRFWLDPIPPEEMPMLAAQMLADGHDTARRASRHGVLFEEAPVPGHGTPVTPERR